MKFLTKTRRFWSILLFFSLFVLWQCSPSIDDTQMDVKVRTNEVSSVKGSTFVSVTCGGNWNLYLIDQTGESITWAKIAPASGTGNKSNVILNYEKNDMDDARELKVVLSTSGKDVFCTFKQNGQKSIVPDPSPDSHPGPESFNGKLMELPEMSSAELEDYYRHDITISGKKYRNYSFIWNAQKRIAPWVAYPLCGMYTVKNVNRTDAWNYDPNLPISQQPNYGHGIGRGYDRGHQIPSADRLCTREANEQTFYFTNMTPQLSGLNQKAWADLEGKVRSWSGRLDTLYVVTGCVLEGSKTVTDNDGNKVAVPSGYYKALLGYKKSATIGSATGGFVGAAFYFDHRAANTIPQPITIDELEAKTGVNFFVNLNPYIEDEVESKIDSFWK